MRAPPKLANPNQKWARMRRRLANTAEPPGFAGLIEEARLVDHLDLGPHALVSGAAEFVAGHGVLARLREFRREARDIARHEHLIKVGALDQEAMDDIGAGGAEGDFRPGRHQDALRREGI